LRTWIAAGGDPGRFWDLTPRLFALEMDGMAERRRLARGDLWWGAMLPHLKRAPSFNEFVGTTPQRQRSVADCVAAWEKVQAAMMRGRK
jgi:hypothetical protein